MQIFSLCSYLNRILCFPSRNVKYLNHITDIFIIIGCIAIIFAFIELITGIIYIHYILHYRDYVLEGNNEIIEG